MAEDTPTRIDGNAVARSSARVELGQLVETIVRRWRAGERPCAADILARHPELAHDSEGAARLIYEEIRLRRESAQETGCGDILDRFPQWRQRVQRLLHTRGEAPGEVDLVRDVRRRANAGPAPTWPAVGESLGDFRLLVEIGRGAQGRVFLAAQSGLADRPVVLKVTTCSGQEHLSLARLQHTSIVPLYTIHEDQERQLRVLCLPWFGGASLQQVLEIVARTPLHLRRGQHLLDALDQAQAKTGELALRTQGPARRLLARVSYVQALCWIGACLAEALHYAHERGLIHLDVKPANVLLAGDGQPMLLDFHLAREPFRRNELPGRGLGGTPLYMSPEQWAGMVAARERRPLLTAVEARSDVYSLGLLLYEALGGSIPLDDSGTIPPLHRCNARVSRGLADILGRCLAPNPDQRYPSAAALATDLRRHLEDRLLRGVPNRSLGERWRKWRRRCPAALTVIVLGAALLSGLGGVGVTVVGQLRQQRQAAETALAQGRQHFQAGAYAQAVDVLTRGKALADDLPWGDALTTPLGSELRLARRAQAVQQLHALVDRLRFLCGATDWREGEVGTLQPRWHALWARRQELLDRRDADLGPEKEERLKTDILDLGTLWVDLSVRLAAPPEREQVCREALGVLADTEPLFGPSLILYRLRQECAGALGQKAAADAAGRRAACLSPRGAWEHCALGRSLLQAGELEQAAKFLDKALEQQPHGFWPHFHHGVCVYRLGRHAEAVGDFRVCVALAPDSADCHHNLALARAAQGEHERALRDYSRALEIEPRMGPAALNRGLLHYEQKRYAAALIDLTHALACGSDPATVHYDLALVHLARQDLPAARASASRALESNPQHTQAAQLRSQLERRDRH